MTQTRFNRLGILKRLRDALIDNGITANVFVSDRPNSVQKQMKDFAVVRTLGSMNDRYAYGESHISIDLFAKDKSEGKEDTFKLQKMMDELMALFPIVCEEFTSYTPKLLVGGDDGLGFHFLMIRAKIVFK